MKYQVRFSVPARRQLAAIFAYVEEQAGRERAERFAGSIVAYCRDLETFPERGTRRDDIAPGLRTLGFRRRVTIAFRVEAEAVTIAGIFYGGQDFETTLVEGD